MATPADAENQWTAFQFLISVRKYDILFLQLKDSVTEYYFSCLSYQMGERLLKERTAIPTGQTSILPLERGG